MLYRGLDLTLNNGESWENVCDVADCYSTHADSLVKDGSYTFCLEHYAMLQPEIADIESGVDLVATQVDATPIAVPLDVRQPDIRSGTLGVPLQYRREPTERDFADPRFDILWELMKRVDVDHRSGLFSGATGHDVCAVLDALDLAMLRNRREL